MPLAGFWNAVIYFRPQYLAARRQRAQSNPSNVSGSLGFLRNRSNRAAGEGSSRGFPRSSRWGLHNPSNDGDTPKGAAKVEESREISMSPTHSPTRRASSFLALDTTYMNEPGVSSVTAAMLEAAKVFESSEQDSIRPSMSNLEEKNESESDLDDQSASVLAALGGDSPVDGVIDAVSDCDESDDSATPDARETASLENDGAGAVVKESMPAEEHSEDIEHGQDRYG